MAEKGAWTAGEDRGHPVSVAGGESMADRVHASVDPMEVTRLHAPPDRLCSHAELQQLPSRDHPVLPSGELRNDPIRMRSGGCDD